MGSKRLIMAWSSGKDSAWALRRLQAGPSFELVGLLTIFSAHERVFMHAVRPEVVPSPGPADRRTAPHAHAPARVQPRGVRGPDAVDAGRGASRRRHARRVRRSVSHVRRHRFELLADTGLEPVFPLWQAETRDLAREMLQGGLETYVTAVDLKKLDRTFVRQRWDDAMIARFPPGTDPCGEGGEFHTCVVGGPMFSSRLPFELGETIERSGYAFADLRLRDEA